MEPVEARPVVGINRANRTVQAEHTNSESGIMCVARSFNSFVIQ